MSSEIITEQDCADFLERNGWLRSVAGETDFNAATKAYLSVCNDGMGLIVGGVNGCGKTSLIKTIAKSFIYPPVVINLGLPGEENKLDLDWWDFRAMKPGDYDIVIDDMGAEKPRNEYGVLYEPLVDFIVYWHFYSGWKKGSVGNKRMLISTNYNVESIDKRYAGRLQSRLKDICKPLHLTGKDKREWAI